MAPLKLTIAGAVACVLSFVNATSAEPAPASDTEELKQMVDALQKRIKAVATPESTSATDVEISVADKFGDAQTVSSHTGRLTIGGLMQVWYQHIQNDRLGITQPGAPGNLLFSINAEPGHKLDNDTFRVRRMELRFGMEVSEHIFAYVMIDPSREANGTYTPFPTFPLQRTHQQQPTRERQQHRDVRQWQ